MCKQSSRTFCKHSGLDRGRRPLRRYTDGDIWKFPVQSSYVLAGHIGPAASDRKPSSNLRRGRCPHRPAVRLEGSFKLCRGRRPRRPAFDVTAPTFQSVSGSGAEGKTILSFGHILQIPNLSTGKEVQKPYGFLRIFGYFLCAQKVPRRRPGKPIYPPLPARTKKHAPAEVPPGRAVYYSDKIRSHSPPCGPERSSLQAHPPSGRR